MFWSNHILQKIMEHHLIYLIYMSFSASAAYLDQVLGVEMPPNQLWYCRLQNCTLYSSYMSSCYLLISMTFERFYSIIRPHKAASFNTMQKARIIIVCIFVLCFSYCTVPKYRAAVDYTPKLRAPRNLPRCTANSDTCKAVANNYPGSATANSYLGTTST